MRLVSRFAARLLIFVCLFVAGQTAHAGEKITIAAAADLKFALDEIVVLFSRLHPADRVETIYGSSGKFQTQIRQGAPFDLYFSADIAYPRALRAEGFAASEVQPYAVGRIVLWSPSRDAGKMTLADLADPAIRKIAIANPKHAPYGKRAEEALKASGVWEKVEAKLVYGENVAQTAQFVQSGNAQVGIIALSLALSPELAKQGGYALIPDRLHQPLEQGFIVTRRAAANPLAQAFARFMTGQEARTVMVRYGFVLPGEAK
ncbi:MAG: molybdate ABC transporter substrate-binding protein [Nitrosomonadales bacterium]|nr:molybdate ABC transporter substrate-binding protein [Nitrosomonadales bacterium]